MVTSAPAPAVRARSAQDILEYLDVFRPGTLAKVEARIPREAYDLIRATVRTGWIPIEYDHYIVDGIVDVLGEADARECWRTFLRGHVRSPLLRNATESAIRILGVGPGTFAWLAARAWDSVYRDFGEMILLERRPGHAALELRDIHKDVLRHSAYFVCFSAVFEGFFDLARTEGKLAWRLDVEQRVLHAELDW
jgi:hypothetical protein